MKAILQYSWHTHHFVVELGIVKIKTSFGFFFFGYKFEISVEKEAVYFQLFTKNVFFFISFASLFFLFTLEAFHLPAWRSGRNQKTKAVVVQMKHLFKSQGATRLKRLPMSLKRSWTRIYPSGSSWWVHFIGYEGTKKCCCFFWTFLRKGVSSKKRTCVCFWPIHVELDMHPWFSPNNTRLFLLSGKGTSNNFLYKQKPI